MTRLLCALVLACWAGSAGATSVFVMSVGRIEVQIMVDQRAVYSLRPGGTTPEGIRLISISGANAELEIDGKSVALGLGQSTLSQTQIKADSLGHFTVTAQINGVPVTSLIDTGASYVSLNREDAARAGVDLSRAVRSEADTANGPIRTYLVTLPRVRVGGIELANVPASVLDGGAGQMPVALIGMSFLKQVELRRSGDTLTLLRADY